MYNSHRGIMPTQPANNRLAELLDGVRQEFDAQAGRATEYEQQRKCSYFHFGLCTFISACVLSFRLVYFHFGLCTFISACVLPFRITW